MKSIESKWYYVGDCLPGVSDDNVLVRVVYCCPEDEEEADERWDPWNNFEWELPRSWMPSFCWANYLNGEWFLHSIPEEVREHKNFKFAVTHWSEGIWEPEEELE